MKKELEIKKEMEDLKKQMEDKREDINDEIVPGSYFYDVKKVEALEEELKNMQEKYERLEAIPTKEKIEAEKEALNQELQKVNEDLEEFELGGIYFPTEEMTKLENRRNELKKEIDKKDEILEVIDEIEKTENEIEELREEENEYTGAYFIPDEILKGIEEKNQKLDELNKKLEEYTNERIEKTGTKEISDIEENKDNPKKVPKAQDKISPNKDDYDKKMKEMDTSVKQMSKNVPPTQEKEEAQEYKKINNELDEILEKNIEIKIDKKGAKVIFGDKEFCIKNSEIKEIVNEKIIKGDKAQYAKYISKLTKFDMKYNHILKEIDPFIIACASKIKNYSGNNKSALEPMMAESLTKRYLEMYANKEKNEKFNITYDLKSLSKPSGLISRMKKEFWNLSDKIAIAERAKKAKEMGLAETEGEFKPNIIDKIFAKVENFANNRLNEKNEKAKEENGKETSKTEQPEEKEQKFNAKMKVKGAEEKTNKVSQEYNEKEEQKHLADNIKKVMDKSEGSNKVNNETEKQEDLTH